MPEIHQHYHASRKYGCAALLLDLLLIGITGGLWIVWIFIRELRGH